MKMFERDLICKFEISKVYSKQDEQSNEKYVYLLTLFKKQ